MRVIYKLKKYRTFFGKYRNLQDRPKNTGNTGHARRPAVGLGG